MAPLHTALSPLRSHVPLMACALRAAVHVEDEARAAAKAEVVARTRHSLRKVCGAALCMMSWTRGASAPATSLAS